MVFVYLFTFGFSHDSERRSEDVCIVANDLARAVMMAEVQQEQHGHLRNSTVDNIRRIQVADVMIDPEIYAEMAD